LIALATLTDFTLVSLTTLRLVLLIHNSTTTTITTTTITTTSNNNNHYEINVKSKLLESWLLLLNSNKGDLNAAALNSISQILDKSDEMYLIFNDNDNDNESNNDNSNSIDEKKNIIKMMELNENNSHSHNNNNYNNDNNNNNNDNKVEVIKLKKFILDMISDMKNINIIYYLLKLATMPISSTRHAAVNLMRSIALQPTGWGLQLLFQTVTTTTSMSSSITSSSSSSYSSGNNNSYTGNKFCDYLFNRHTEYSKDGKDFKFSLIQAIYHNQSKIHLSQDINDKIHIMIQQGAYYLTPRTADPQLMEN